jgi:serine/threonine-protein kinase
LILEQLQRMLASDTFAGTERSRALLRFLVEHVVENRPDRLKEYTIGSEALGRGDSFDPRTDPIVRAEASRLRSRIERYYATSGAADTVLITLPKGSYVPQFQGRAIPEAAPVAVTAGGPLPTAGRFQRFFWFVLGGISVGAAVMLFISVRPGTPAAEFGGLPFEIKPGTADYTLGSDIGNDVIISPGGTRIVFVALGSDHVPRLMALRLDAAAIGPRRVLVPGPGAAVRLADGARAPFFSPDGLWVGFWDQADAKLKMVSVDGGSAIVLADAGNFGGASWGDNGYIIAAIDGVLKRVSSSPPGESSVVADLKKERVDPLWPDLLPGGTHVLFTAVGPQGPDASNIEVLSLLDNKRKPLVKAGFGRYLRAGYLLYVNQGTLFAVPFDSKQQTIHGTGVRVLEERVAYSTVFGNAKFDISHNGTLIYRGSPRLVAAWLNRDGGTGPLPSKPGAYTFPRLSPSGQHLAINVTDGGVFRVEVYDLRHPTAAPKRLPDTFGNMSSVWHPDGFLVLGSRTGMSWTKVDDLSRLERLTETSNVQIPWSFNADGTRLAYAEQTKASPSLDLWTVPVSRSGGKLTAGKPEPFLTTAGYESFPSFSPDGRWMLYGRGVPARWEVYVQPYPPDVSRETRISQRGGRIGRWLSNGREIVYRTDDHRLMVVGYQVRNGTFIPGEATEWTPARLGDTGVIANFDVSGDRVLGLVPEAGDEAERIRTQATVIPRFSEEVRRRLERGGK